MKTLFNSQFSEIWLVDFEFTAVPGELPVVLCMVAKEYFSGRTIKCWRDELLAMAEPPFNTEGGALFVAYYASAEISCFQSLGWSPPRNILDLYVEFRCHTNGAEGGGNGLIAALRFYGLPSIEDTEKESMRALAMRGGSYSAAEQLALLDYCETDVVALHNLLPAIEKDTDLLPALLRGTYMAAVATIESHGMPIDIETLSVFRAHWEDIKSHLIAAVDTKYGVYVGQSFKKDRFKFYLAQRGISWPMLPSGQLELSAEVFKEKAKIHPELQGLHELRTLTSRLRLSDFPVGLDGRNRCMLSPFSSKTGRNQPKTSKFVFGLSSWLRGLIKPSEGHGLAYIDWSQQEFGIAAALSGDIKMMAAYESGDPYLEFAKQAGAVPPDATKHTHREERERFKSCCLGMNYSMGAASLALRAGIHELEALRLIELHHQTYQTFWKWSESAVNYAMMYGKIHTFFVWQCRVPKMANPRSFANFPMQGNGAEILRLACIYGIKRGIKICAPVHDAVLIEAPIEVLDDHIAIMQDAMRQASRDVLGGFELRSDVKKVLYPDRYMDERGVEMWEMVQTIVQQLTSADAA